jgi:CheY-like chemotaxis protein
VKPTDLNVLVERTAAMFGRTRKELKIHTTLAPDLWVVDVDQGQLEQVLMNLFVNAWHAMPAGGDMSLVTGNLTLDEAYVAPYAVPAGRYVRVSVSDTGVGMDEATRQRVFEPFFTTREMGRGTGLGLATVYGIVKGHGGLVNVYSEKGRGSTFNVYLPASDSVVPERLMRGAELSHGSETLLLVDDEPAVLAIAQKMLESLGYSVIAARGGAEAIECYQQHRERIDLIMLDMIMPEVSGSETFERLRQVRPDVRVLLSSGYSLNGLARDLVGRGCRAFIQKPFDLEELAAKVRQALDEP